MAPGSCLLGKSNRILPVCEEYWQQKRRQISIFAIARWVGLYSKRTPQFQPCPMAASRLSSLDEYLLLDFSALQRNQATCMSISCSLPRALYFYRIVCASERLHMWQRSPLHCDLDWHFKGVLIPSNYLQCPKPAHIPPLDQTLI